MKILRISLIFSSAFFVSQTLLFAASGSATIQATQADSKVAGEVSFQETPEGLKMTAVVTHASPGKHAIHIHENGDCSDAGKAAGSHFNPDNAPHGLVTKGGPQQAHAGDMGNIEIGPDGTGQLEEVLPNVTLGEGKYSVAGRSVILHEKEDDFGQPSGNAGSRIGCGKIVLTQ